MKCNEFLAKMNYVSIKGFRAKRWQKVGGKIQLDFDQGKTMQGSSDDECKQDGYLSCSSRQSFFLLSFFPSFFFFYIFLCFFLPLTVFFSLFFIFVLSFLIAVSNP
jgi:hypothetical protein